jgi:hypothetical protein
VVVVPLVETLVRSRHRRTPMTVLLPLAAGLAGAVAGWWAHARHHAHRQEPVFWSEVTTRAMAEAADRQYDRAEAAETRLRRLRGTP